MIGVISRTNRDTIRVGRYHVNSFSHGTMDDIAGLGSLVEFELLLKTLKSENKQTAMMTIFFNFLHRKLDL